MADVMKQLRLTIFAVRAFMNGNNMKRRNYD